MTQFRTIKYDHAKRNTVGCFGFGRAPGHLNALQGRLWESLRYKVPQHLQAFRDLPDFERLVFLTEKKRLGQLSTGTGSAAADTALLIELRLKFGLSVNGYKTTQPWFNARAVDRSLCRE